jgi:hypothetical protein
MIWTHWARAAAYGSPPVPASAPPLEPPEPLPDDPLDPPPELPLDEPELDDPDPEDPVLDVPELPPAPELEVLAPPPELELLPELLASDPLEEPLPLGAPPLGVPVPSHGFEDELHAAPAPSHRRTEVAATRLDGMLFIAFPPLFGMTRPLHRSQEKSTGPHAIRRRPAGRLEWGGSAARM